MTHDPLATVTDYAGLHAALRARATDLKISRETLDHISGLQCGYSAKLLALQPAKNLGVRSLSMLLGALGLKLLVVEDPEALARVRRRITPREEIRVRQSKSTPTYRATRDGLHTGLGMYNTGQEFAFMGWPKAAGMEPSNTAASRIAEYWARHRQNPHCPPSPTDPDHGRVYLPAHLADPRSTRLPPLPDIERPGMPRYRSKFRNEFGAKVIEAGTEFSYCAWPTASMEPVNEAAQLVTAYLDKHKSNPARPAAPWCEFERALFLPEIAEARPQVYARDLSERARNAYEVEFDDARIRGAQEELRRLAGPTNLPQWRAARMTTGSHNRVFNEGAVVTGDRPMRGTGIVNRDWEPANEAARALCSDPVSLPDASPAVRAPMAGMRRIGATRGGTPIMSPHREATAPPPDARPLWKFTGAAIGMVDGEMRRPGERFFSENVVRDRAVEPVNDRARELLSN